MTIPTNHQLRLRTLAHRLPDQLRHILTPRSRASGFKAGDIGSVIVDALNGHLGCAEHAVEGGDKGRSDDAADVAAFGGAAGENEGQIFAGAGDEVVAGGAVEVDGGAGGGDGGGGDAGEATGGLISIFGGICGYGLAFLWGRGSETRFSALMWVILYLVWWESEGSGEIAYLSKV